MGMDGGGMSSLRDRIIKRKAKVRVIGLGYAGLPLAVEFAKAGFKVVGIDVNKRRVKRINEGSSYIPDVKEGEIKPLVRKNLLKAEHCYKALKGMDVAIICVPTPLRKTKEPDISYIISAAREVSKYLQLKNLVILESTTYPGTTEDVILPILESKGFKVGRDFYLAFSPERIDPGNKKYGVCNIPKVVGGITKRCTEITNLLYSQVVDEVVPVSSPRVAEMVKLLENTFRITNVGLANEMALMCDRMGIDVWEVIDAASTKPFGFIPFYPGPGLGGHCIPVDPLYLSWKARLHDFEPRFIELAAEVNRRMPHHVVDKVVDALNEKGKSVKGSKILLLGVSYKRNVSDIRESPALDIAELLKGRGAKVSYSDPYVPELKVGGKTLRSVRLRKGTLKDKDCVVIITDHDLFNYPLIVEGSRLIVDTRNATRGIKKHLRRRIIRL